VEAHELVLAGGDSRFTSSKLRLQRVQRGPGENDIGMVAWHMTLKTPECQQGRQVIAVANDITHQSGAFGPKEDAVFRAAGELALQERLPLVYLAANSGARVGVATEVGPQGNSEAVKIRFVSLGLMYASVVLLVLVNKQLVYLLELFSLHNEQFMGMGCMPCACQE
jgi:hypothetical protein